MDFTGTLVTVNRDIVTRKVTALLEINESSTFLNMADKLIKLGKLRIGLKKYREKRSLDANAYLWHLLGAMADRLNEEQKTDTYTKDILYVMMLEDYGKYVTLSIPLEAIEDFKKQWNLMRVQGESETTATVLCFIGSSNYDTKEMSQLLNGVVDRCRLLGIPTKEDEELERLIEMHGENYG